MVVMRSYSLERRPRRALPTFALIVAGALLPFESSAWSRQEPAPPAPAAERATLADQLEPRHRQWLDSVEGLITEAEREYFLGLRHDFRRDAFIEAFWRLRDPDPRTPVNELQRRFEEYHAASGGLPPMGDPRALLYLLNGPPGRWTLPDGRPVSRCFSRSRELEIWFYGGSELVARRFLVIFQKRGQAAPYETWLPGGQLRPTQRSGLPTRDVSQLCADELVAYATATIARISDYDSLLDQILSPPRPPAEWLATFAAAATDLPADAETFDADLAVTYPARNQSRTAVQAVVEAPLAAAPGRRFDGALFHDFQLAGEIIRDGELFESFRYRFEGPTPDGAAAIPLGFTRYLRPGPATLRLLVEDVFGGRFAQFVREIDVPSPEGRPAVTADVAPGGGSERPALELQPPAGDVHAGLVRFSARWNGPLEGSGALERVVFYLDDREVLSKRTPPYSVELDLGAAPSPHRVRVVGYADDREVATDQVWLNQGARRFRIELLEPRPGGIYPGSLTARVAVETPAEERVARVELYVDEQHVATLEEEPWARALELPPGRPAVVRAVAYLDDGSAAEDAVLVNAAGLQEAVAVRLVELYPLVLDSQGRPIRDLERSDFRVLDQGEPRAIERFERAADSPLRSVLLVDRSSSMAGTLEPVAGAALSFARAVLAPAGGSPTGTPERDQVAVLSFADQPTIDVESTTQLAAIERGLAGLRPLGGTALWDSLATALNYLGAEAGPSAVILFTDGQDENSRLQFEQVRAAARASGAMLYALATVASFGDRDSRRQLEDLAAETGGRAYFLDALDALDDVYAEILGELRARYLLAFTPPDDAPASFRPLTLEVDRRGARVLVRGGYVP
jgi:Ca-activated chloride channel family protein